MVRLIGRTIPQITPRPGGIVADGWQLALAAASGADYRDVAGCAAIPSPVLQTAPEESAVRLPKPIMKLLMTAGLVLLVALPFLALSSPAEAHIGQGPEIAAVQPDDRDAHADSRWSGQDGSGVAAPSPADGQEDRHDHRNGDCATCCHLHCHTACMLASSAASEMKRLPLALGLPAETILPQGVNSAPGLRPPLARA